MDNCKNCNHECHCNDEHTDEYLDICTCNNCECEKGKAQDSTYEHCIYMGRI